MKRFTFYTTVFISLFMLVLCMSCKKGLYVPAEGDTIYLTVNPTTIEPGETATITITGIKANGSPMADETLVQLQVDLGTLKNPEGNSVAAAVLTSGKAEVIYHSDDDPAGGTATVTASSGSATVSPEALTIAITSLEVSQLFMTAYPLQLAPDGGTVTITVTAVNSVLDPINNAKTWLSTTAGALYEDSNLTTLLTTFLLTGANGQEDGKVTAYLVTTEAATVTATYKDVTASVDITLGVNTAPVADFNFSPTAPVSGDTVYFISNSSDPDGDSISHYWQFGDGGTSSSENPSHTYPEVTVATEYVVQLTVTDSGGLSATAVKNITIGLEANEAPVADFTFSPTNPTSSDSVFFNAQASTDTDGTIINYAWDFGDGVTGSGRTTNHTYSNATGETTYTVTLTVKDDKGATGTVSKEITVNASSAAKQKP